MLKKRTRWLSLCVALYLAAGMTCTAKTPEEGVQGTGVVITKTEQKEETKPLELYFMEGLYQEDSELISKLSEVAYVQASVTEETDVLALLDRNETDLKLYFTRDMLAAEGQDGNELPYIVIPEFEAAIDWKREGEPEENFLAVYQRKRKGSMQVECFTIQKLNQEEEQKENPTLDVCTYLRVSKGEATWILDTEAEEGIYLGDARSDYFEIKDINFDGKEDITLQTGHYGNQGIVFEFGWIWSEKEQDYLLSDSYFQIGNPDVDEEQKIVRSSWRNSAVSHGWGIYGYENGQFVLQSRLTEDLLREEEILQGFDVPEAGEVWCWTEEIFTSGICTEENKYYAVSTPETPAAYPEAYYGFMERDSYWGYPQTAEEAGDVKGFFPQGIQGYAKEEVFCELRFNEIFNGKASLEISRVAGARSANYYELILTDFDGKCYEHGEVAAENPVAQKKKKAEQKVCMYTEAFPVAYIYADEDKIYWMPHEEAYTEIFRQINGFPTEEYITALKEVKMEAGDHSGYFTYRTVCTEEGVEDNYRQLQFDGYTPEPGMNGDARFHNSVDAIGNRREYSLYPDKEYAGGTVERMFLIWEMGQGLTYFENWVGAYRDYIAFWM